MANTTITIVLLVYLYAIRNVFCVEKAKLDKFMSLGKNQGHMPTNVDKTDTASFILKYNFNKEGCNSVKDHTRKLSQGGIYKKTRDEVVNNLPHVVSKVFGENVSRGGKTVNSDIFKTQKNKNNERNILNNIINDDTISLSFLPKLNMESVTFSGELGRKAMNEKTGKNNFTDTLMEELMTIPCVDKVVYHPKAELFSIKVNRMPEFIFDNAVYEDENIQKEYMNKYPQDENMQHLWWYMSRSAIKQNYPDGEKFILPRVQEVHNAIWTGEGTDYKVGVIDTGLDFTHPDFFNPNTYEKQYYFNEAEAGGKKFEDFDWWNECTDMIDGDDNGFTDDCFGLDIEYQWGPWSLSDPFPIDYDSHGTHVSGTVATKTDNDLYVSGACPGCQIVPITPMYIFEALEYAAAQNIKILNMSFGYSRGYVSRELYDIFIEAFTIYHEATDGLIVAAAGNEPYDADDCKLEDDDPIYCKSYSLYYGFPCQLSVDLPFVVCVGASDYYGKSTVFSTYGKKSVQVFAPGTDIYSTVPVYLMSNAGILRSYRGTSMASPLVAGIAGLIRSKFPNLTAAQVRKALVASCTVTPHLAHKTECGGVVDSLKALAHATVCSQTPNACGRPIQFGKDDNNNIFSWFCKKASVFGHALPFCN